LTFPNRRRNKNSCIFLVKMPKNTLESRIKELEKQNKQQNSKIKELEEQIKSLSIGKPKKKQRAPRIPSGYNRFCAHPDVREEAKK